MSISATPISQRKPAAGCSIRALIPFGILFALAGLGLFWAFFIRPVTNVWRSSRWPATEARILRSSFEEVPGDNGTNYKPDIEYEYTVAGQTHRSRRVNFFYGDTSTSGRKWIDRLCAEYPAGSVRTCYYDPRKTDEAILKRGYSWFLLLGLLPLLIFAAGLLMVWAGFRGADSRSASGQRASALKDRLQSTVTTLDSGAGSKPTVPASGSGPTVAHAGSVDDGLDDDEDLELDDIARGIMPWAEWEGPRKLAPETTLLSRVIGLGLGALIWNGIVAVVFWNVFGKEWFMVGVLFFGLFALVGLGLLVGFLHQLLCLFNPVIEIALENGAVPAGGELVLAWETRGNAARIRELVIEVVAREKATYTRGTDTTTDVHEMARLPAVSVTDPSAMRFGSATVRIPETAIHSFDAARNKIEWSIEIRGRIPFWPDVSERFPFFVKPLGC